MNEPFFQGHFPGNPVMPGVLQIEAMAQVGGIFALSGVEDPENWSTYFMKIDNVRFKQKVVPGDTVLFQLAIGQPHSPGTGPHDGPGLMWETSSSPRQRCSPRSSATASPLLLPHESDGNPDSAIDFSTGVRTSRRYHWRGVSPLVHLPTIGANVHIGAETWIGPNATILDGSRIGAHCRVFPWSGHRGYATRLEIRR